MTQTETLILAYTSTTGIFSFPLALEVKSTSAALINVSIGVSVEMTSSALESV